MNDFCLQLGIIGFLLIGALTDHCCHLIARVKHHAIDRLVEDQVPGNRSSKRKYYTVNNRSNTPGLDSGVDDDDDSDAKDSAPLIIERDEDTLDRDDDDNDADDESESDIEEMREHMFKHMTYGDIGKLSFGKFGVGIVNFCIALTQFGFCVAYCIFIGNTIHSLFPSDLCYTVNGTSICSPYEDGDKSHVKRSVNTTDMFDADYLYSGQKNISQLLPQSNSLSDLETTLAPFLAASESNGTTSSSNQTTKSTIAPTTATTSSSNVTTTTTLVPPSTTTESNITTTLNPNITTTPNVTMADFIRTVKSRAPDLKILVAAPVPIFIVFALIRSVRYLGVISMIANASILVGLVALFGFLLSGKNSPPPIWQFFKTLHAE